MVLKLRPEKKQRTPVMMRERTAEHVELLIPFIGHLTRKSLRRKRVRTIAVPAWSQNFLWRKRCQKRWRLKYKTMRR